MKKILTIAMMMAAAQAYAGTAAMETLRNSAGPAAAGFSAPDAPAAEAAAQETRGTVHPKIGVSPVTASWKNTMLVFFRKVSLDSVKAAMEAAGGGAWTLGENDGAYIARLDIPDAQAPGAARALSAQTAVERIEVNRSVYAALREGRGPASQGTQVMKLFKKGPAILAEVETSESLQYIAAFRADGPVENLPYIDVSMQVRYTKGGQLAWAEQKVRAMWTKNGFMAPPVNVSWLVPDTRRIVAVQLTYRLDSTHTLDYIIQTSSEDHGVLLADEPAIIGIAPDLIAKLKAYIAK